MRKRFFSLILYSWLKKMFIHFLIFMKKKTFINFFYSWIKNVYIKKNHLFVNKKRFVNNFVIQVFMNKKPLFIYFSYAFIDEKINPPEVAVYTVEGRRCQTGGCLVDASLAGAPWCFLPPQTPGDRPERRGVCAPNWRE